jgi:hypothetical protein
MRESSPLSLDRLSRDLHRKEEGMLSLASLFVVLGFLVLIGLLANAGMTASRKLETQNAADAVAYSAGVEMARGMNSVTAINHLIGELTALAVLIHTLGGDDLYNGTSPPRTPQDLQYLLEGFNTAAQGISENAIPQVYGDAYKAVQPDPDVGGAIYYSRIRLKLVLAWALEVHIIGGLIVDVGKALEGFFGLGFPIEAAGDAICYAAWSFEFKVWSESKILDVVEDVAKGLNDLRVEKTIREVIVPALYLYQDGFVSAPVVSSPWKAKDAANATQAPNLADEVSLYPPLSLVPLPVPQLQLPVMKNKDFDTNNPKRSQLMRATTPWVQWWRQEWIDFGKDALLLSRFAYQFERFSTQYSLSIVQSLLNDKNIYLYVMSNPDPQGRGKTFEPWTYADQPDGDMGGRAGSEMADKMFCVVGMAHRPAPPVASPFVGTRALFRQENAGGMACYAQAMFYNANPQVHNSGTQYLQSIAGWDTLNWGVDNQNQPVRVPEYPGPVPPGDDTPTPTTPQPIIRLNWQSKLVPTTRLAEATGYQVLFQPGSTSNVLQRAKVEETLLLYPNLNLAKTH